jgi:prepilin-type N-terminal cleavage/methylation domain-containing protein
MNYFHTDKHKAKDTKIRASRRWTILWWRTLLRSNQYRLGEEKGFSLLEVLLAVALVGILGTAIPSALSTANRTTIISNEHTMAESLARSQMDYVQNQTYDSINNPPVYAVISNLPTGYSITQTVVRLDPKGDLTANDDGLQQITVTVQRGANIAYTLVDFKVNFNP